jgi:hypothetical protein
MSEKLPNPAFVQYVTRGAGRPKQFKDAELRDVWVYVQSWAILTKKPISQICDSKNAGFSWYALGTPGGGPGPRLEHKVDRQTLRRRYYEAVRFLKAESKDYRALRKAGYVSSVFGEVSPTEEWWRRLRDENVSRIKISLA